MSSHPYRRTIIRSVSNGGPMTRRALAEEIAATAGTVHADDPVESIEIVLHHQHIPQLSHADIVDYDAVRGIVHPRDGTRQVNAVSEIAASVADVL